MVAIRERQLRLIAIENLRSTQVTVGVRMRSDFVRQTSCAIESDVTSFEAISTMVVGVP